MATAQNIAFPYSYAAISARAEIAMSTSSAEPSVPIASRSKKSPFIGIQKKVTYNLCGAVNCDATHAAKR